MVHVEPSVNSCVSAVPSCRTAVQGLVSTYFKRVSILQSKRKGIRALPLFFLALGLCIFAWGIRYKLSLYHSPHAASPTVPHAKLLSKNERPEADASVTLLVSAETADGKLLGVWQFAGDTLFMSALPAMQPRRPVHAGPQPKDRMLERAGLRVFFFRPPPILS